MSCPLASWPGTVRKAKRFLSSADFTSSPYLHLDQHQQDPGTCHASRFQKGEANKLSKDKICC